MAIGQDLLNVPMGEMIYSMASSIAKSQIELDRASIEVAEMMGGLKTIYDDQGKMTFSDSRVFFGHEYMTVAEAMITQGTGNPMATAMIAAEKLNYRAYTPASATTIETTAIVASPPDVTNVPLDATSVAAYQANAKAIADGIVALQNLRDAAIPAKVPNFTLRITELKALQAANKASAANVFERQFQFPTRLSLLELGFTPTFYQFVDTIIEVKISITITQENSSTTTTGDTSTARAASIGFRFTPFGRGRGSAQTQTTTSQVNATYSNRYSYTAEGSSLLRTKLTPLPPPAVLEERIRGMMAGDQARRAAQLSLLTTVASTA
jgi:hypothetical protein